METQEVLKGWFTQKLALVSLQTCMTYFIPQNTKKDTEPRQHPDLKTNAK